MLESLVRSVDITVSCAGGPPSLLKIDWVKERAKVINMGVTFNKETDVNMSDFDGGLEKVANRFIPVPGDIGLLSVAALFRNMATSAWVCSTDHGEVHLTWTRKSALLQRSVHYSVLAFANKVNAMSSEMDHHANTSFSHKCVDGVDLDLEFFTFEANGLTGKDYEATRKVNAILESKKVKISDFPTTVGLSP
jgi:pterin-4a-carbinolamine dehydratase